MIEKELIKALFLCSFKNAFAYEQTPTYSKSFDHFNAEVLS
jgi:hypothetical protein